MTVRFSTSILAVMALVYACAIDGCGGTSVASSVSNGARLVEVVSAVSREQPSGPSVAVEVIVPSRVRRIVAWINRMRPVPPGAYSCPAVDAVEPTVALAFRAYAGGPVLAKATEIDYGYGSFPCNPLTLTVPGGKNRSLAGGLFLERLQRLLGVSLGFGEGTVKGEIYMAGGPAPSKGPIAGRVSLYLANQRSRYANALTRSETLPRPGQFIFSGIGPGAYFLRATVRGKPFDCPRTMVIVRVGKTTYAKVPWGCTIS